MKRIQRLGLIGALGLLGLWGGELLVRQLDPQEVNGWGERPSLTPDATTGWHLQPSQRTRLRWEHYDYTVTANSLGFPAPEYPVAKAANTLRIMTTGDAFTSAEGVDTEAAWPRLLERQLAQQLPGRKVEVINFAITGHGPNQYAAVIQKYAPIYRPDVILAEFFVNDFADVLTTDESFREQIGFAKVPQDHWQYWLKLSHLRRFVRGRWFDPALAAIRQQPGGGEVWGHLYAFELPSPDQLTQDQLGQDKLADRMAAIHQVATQIGAKVIVPMVPSSLQVCQPGQLPYYPLNGPLQQRLNDPRYDRNRPQTRIQAAAQASGLATYDLRLPLQASAQCPYHPANMHWLPSGHQAVADFLAQKLVTDGWLQKVKRP